MRSYLLGWAEYHEDAGLAQRIREADDAMRYEGELFTPDEMADLMGIERRPDGTIPVNPFINGCLSIDTFERVQALPRDQRVRAMCTAFQALEGMSNPRMHSPDLEG